MKACAANMTGAAPRQEKCMQQSLKAEMQSGTFGSLTIASRRR
jgi:hypothetical protein